MPVLQYLDVVLGVAVVMLILATVVASASQTVMTVWMTRSRYLVDALDALLERSLSEKVRTRFGRLGVGKQVSGLLEKILTDSRVGHKSILWSIARIFNPDMRGLKLAPPEEVRREEFVLLLMEKLAEDKDKDKDKVPTLDFDPAAALERVRELALTEEKNHPDKASSEWRAQAILKLATETSQSWAESQRAAFARFLGPVFESFDNAMDRVADHSALAGRRWSAVVAFVVVFALGVDTFDLVRRLSMDEPSRQQLVELARQASTGDADLNKKAKDIMATGRLSFGGSADSLFNPFTPKEPLDANAGMMEQAWYTADWIRLSMMHWIPYPGVWVTWVLVSLGAPFWLELIRKLLGFRNLIGSKEEQARANRAATAGKPTGS